MRNHENRWIGFIFGTLLVLFFVPQSLAEDCEPTKLGTLQAVLASAEAATRGAPKKALEHLDNAEKMLLCLSEPVTKKDLSDLYRLRAISYLRLKDRDQAREAFVRAANYDPDLDCKRATAGYRGRQLIRSARIMCNASVSAIEQTAVGVRIIEFKGAEKIYVNGVLYPPRGDSIALDLSPGKHLIQVAHKEGLGCSWFEIIAPALEIAKLQQVSVRDLEIIPREKEVLLVGSLELQGLAPGTEVVLDGRKRRDLPVLRNVEAGERHLLLRTPDGSTRGVTVTVKANETTVFLATPTEVPSEGLFSGSKLLAFSTLGLGAVSAIGSGVTFGLAAASYGAAGEDYDAYAALTTGSAGDFESPFASALAAQEKGNSLQSVGWILGGVAVAAAGAGTYFLVSDSGEGLAELTPFLAPVVDESSDASGIAFGLRGRF